MKDDADPFLCEYRAYQQIQKSCTPEERSHFLAFYGITEIQMTDVIPSVKPDADKRSGIVLYANVASQPANGNYPNVLAPPKI